MADRICLGCMEKIKDIYDVCPYCGYVDGTPAKEAYHLTPGTVINGKYIVGQVIGYGGFGVTYIGYDGLLEKKIAIKEYLPSEFGTRMPGQTEVTIYSGEREEQFYSGIEKFVDEARRLAQFTDVPGIVHIFDSFMENKTAYIVMEYLEGETLKEHLAKEGKIGVEEALGIMIPILDALQEVHKIGIIHRDIAPDNIFLTRDGKVKLLDFGAARYATTTHSKSLSVIIKQGYAPEEQYRSRGDQGPWTDVYACGATLYKMLTGITPEDSMERVGKDTLVPPSKKGAKTSKNLDTAIMNAMNLAIEDRTQSAKEFEDELMSEAEVKRKKQHDRKVDIGRWPLWVKITSGAVAALVLVFVGLLLTGVIHFDMGAIVDRGTLAAGTVYVPNLVNYAVDEAEAKTIEHELILQVMDKQNSEVIPKDKILSQNVQDGYVVEVGSTIEVAVSAGGEIVYLPELEGLSEEEARKALEDLGLRVESVEEPSEVAPGYVIRYDALRVDEDTQETQVVDSTNGVEKNKTIIKLYISSGIDDIDETKDTTVPKLIGMDYITASQTAGTAKLYIYRSGSEYSSTIPKGQIMRQDVAEGTKVKEGTRIGVVISLGEQMARVPDVQYKDMNEAINLLTSNNLSYDVQYEDSDTVAKDHVIRQSVAAGTEVAMQTKVTIYISKGNPNANKQTVIVAENTTAASTAQSKTDSSSSTTPDSSSSKTSETTNTGEEKATVPDVVGKSLDSAVSLIQKAGLTANISYKQDSNATEGTVLSQSVASGSKVAKNSSVSIVIAEKEEEEKITVPNVLSMTESEAKKQLSNLGLKVTATQQEDDATTGTVISQSVTAGSQVPKDSAITIVIAKEIMVTVPNVVGKTETVAKSELTSAGLKVEVTYETDDSKTKDTVQSQSVASGKKVSKNTTVSLVVTIEEGKIEVPNLVGMTETEAKTAITNAKLKVGEVYYRNNGETTGSDKQGKVLAQGTESGSKVKKNTIVNFTVCDNTKKTQYAMITATVTQRTVNSDSQTSTTGYPSTVPSGWESMVKDGIIENINYDGATGWRESGPYTKTDTQEPVTDSNHKKTVDETYYVTIFRKYTCNNCGYPTVCPHGYGHFNGCAGGSRSGGVQEREGMVDNIAIYMNEQVSFGCATCFPGRGYRTANKYYLDGQPYWYAFSDEINMSRTRNKEVTYTAYGYYPKVTTYTYHYTKTENDYSWPDKNTLSESSWSDNHISISDSTTQKEENREVYVYQSYN